MARQLRSLDGQVVAITGGGRGIGRATAAALIAKGARVAIGDIDAPLAERTASELGLGDDRPAARRHRPGELHRRSWTRSRAASARSTCSSTTPGSCPSGRSWTSPTPPPSKLVDINIMGVILGSKLALQRFRPRGRGHIVQLASIAGKGGFPGGATYCATKHAVVGLTEALRAELRGTGIEIHQVLPIGVNTELYSGVSQARGFKTPEPEDVADAIVELLQTGKFELYVPRQTAAVVRMQALMPRRITEAVVRFTKGDRVLLSADPSARAAYDARMAQMFDGPAVPVAVPDAEARDAAAGLRAGSRSPRRRLRRLPGWRLSNPPACDAQGHGASTTEPARSSPDLRAGVLLEEVRGAGDHVVDLAAERGREPPAGLERQHRIGVGPQEQLGPRIRAQGVEHALARLARPASPARSAGSAGTRALPPLRRRSGTARRRQAITSSPGSFKHARRTSSPTGRSSVRSTNPRNAIHASVIF